jgi:hypothetical protein
MFIKMKKSIVTAITLFIAMCAITSCGGPKEEETVPPGKKVVDLSKYGKPFTMWIPDSTVTSGPVNIIEQNYMLEVQSGKTFSVIVEEGEGNMEQVKNDIKSDEINKFKRYLAEEPTMIAWESEITQPEFHLYAVVTVGTAKYVIRDGSSTEREPFTEADVKQMMEAVKSIKEKQKEEA